MIKTFSKRRKNCRKPIFFCAKKNQFSFRLLPKPKFPEPSSSPRRWRRRHVRRRLHSPSSHLSQGGNPTPESRRAMWLPPLLVRAQSVRRRRRRLGRRVVVVRGRRQWKLHIGRVPEPHRLRAPRDGVGAESLPSSDFVSG